MLLGFCTALVRQRPRRRCAVNVRTPPQPVWRAPSVPPGEVRVHRGPGHRARPQATQPVESLPLAQELKEVPRLPSGLLPAALWFHQTDRRSFLPGMELLKSKLPISPKTPGAGHSPQPEPARRGYWLVLTGTAGSHGFTFSCCATPGDRTSTSGPSQSFCSFSRSLANREAGEGDSGAPSTHQREHLPGGRAIAAMVKNSGLRH